MSNFNISNTHPLITNANQYMFQKKYISIHSEDRDIKKFPSASSFEIELPQDYLNVQTIRLNSWTFPPDLKNVFSCAKYNISLVFTINNPYIPPPDGTELQLAIYSGLISLYNTETYNFFVANIEEGNYTPQQMATELTNCMNKVVTDYLVTYLTINSTTIIVDDFLTGEGYAEFIIVYNEISQKLWFGNRSSGFILNNNSCIYELNELTKNTTCENKYETEEYINWGLPWYLGLTYCSQESIEIIPYLSNGALNKFALPCFNYDNTVLGGNYWLKPSTSNLYSNVYFIECPMVINITGDTCFYMEIIGLNNIDETQPFNISTFTNMTNITNGVVNSSFAKIDIDNLNYSCDSNGTGNGNYNQTQRPYKYYDPPAERIRRLYFKFRYHNGMLIRFDNLGFTFTLELGLLNNNIERKYSIQVPEAIKYFS